MFKFTLHALARIRQRGKSSEGVKMVLRHGVKRNQDSTMLLKKHSSREIERRNMWLKRLSGTRLIYARAIRKRIKMLEKMRGCVVITQGTSIITVYNESRKKAKKRRYRRRKGL